MPNFLNPRQSGSHRIAAIALYRALFKQCCALSVDKQRRSELENIIRNRFKQSQHVQSTRRLRLSFEAGYDAIDYLDAAVAGNVESKSYILSLLERAPAKAKLSPTPTSKQRGRKSSETARVDATEDASEQRPRLSLFDRPLPLNQLSGKRHVPVLFSANHIPILRIKKPQPESLSRFIRQRIKKRQQQHDHRHRLYVEHKLASLEDEWDRIIARYLHEQGDKEMTGSREPMWRNAVSTVLDEVHAWLNDEREKNRITAEKMQAVVDREQELFDKEKAQAKQVKMREKLQRQRSERKAIEINGEDSSP